MFFPAFSLKCVGERLFGFGSQQTTEAESVLTGKKNLIVVVQFVLFVFYLVDEI